MNDGLRIMESKNRWTPDPKKYYISFPYYEVLSADFKEVLSEHKTYPEAAKELERIIKQEKLACSTGSCED